MKGCGILFQQSKNLYTSISFGKLMMEKGLFQFFEKYLNKSIIFKDKKILQSNYTPEYIFHRDEQIQQIASILAPCLHSDKPSNLFIYGKTGTGKTLTTKYVTNQLNEIATQKNLQIKIIYINCKLRKVADTEYRVLAQLIKFFGKEMPPTGLPTDELYTYFFQAVDKEKQIIILVLDEIDQLVNKIGDSILYNLTRINAELKQAQITIVGISNNLMFTEYLDPRVKSSLSEEELVFPPYNAIHIQEILTQRAKLAFNDAILEQGLIEKCAAYAAREHGDARRALELLRVAGELAERENSNKVLLKHLDFAEEKIEKDRLIDLIKNQPKQYHATLFSIFQLKKEDSTLFTGEIYEYYQQICQTTGLRPLTQRRISDIIAEFDLLGIVNAKVISKGRYGRTREITLSIPLSLYDNIKKIVTEELGIQ